MEGFTYCMLTPIIILCTFTHSKYDIVSHVPGPPLFFCSLVWVQYYIGSRRVVENEEGLGTHMRWTRVGRREGRGGGSVQLQMCASWL